MKKKQVVAVVGMLMALGVFAETWTDSKTGLTWTYQVVGDGVSVGGDDSTTALPASTSGAIEIPSVINGIKVTCIGNSAFRSCSLLNEIVIPEGVEIVGDSAFQYCESLESMAFPVGVRSIGRWTFSGCNALSSVNIPESVTNIGYLAFGSCTSLVSLTVSEANAHYRSIENVMFSKDMKTLVACAGGKSGDYEIPCGVEEIGVWAFEGCRKISSLTLPLSVTQIGWRAVNNLGNLVSFAVDTANSFYKAVNGLLLTKDGTVLLAGVNGDVSIPDGVVYIDGQAFYGCRGLVGITIPPSVKSIGYRAFDGCSGLVALTIPSTVTEMDAYAFNGCSGLKSVAISDGLTYIPDFAFSGCEVLKSVTIPLKVESVGNYAFFGCKGLASISIPSCVTSVGNCAFSGCAELESIAFPYGLTSVGAEAFYDCSSLTSVTLPSSVENIGRYAFSNCRGLTSMSLPPGIESIEYGLFNNCSGLTTVTIPSNVVKIEDWAFGGCSALQRMTIPSSVSQIGYEAFYECENLNAIDFEWEPPEGLASAGIAADAAIRYHAECEDEWLPVIEECGFTNATPYVPPKPDGGPYTEIVDGIEWAFVVANGEASVGTGAQGWEGGITAVPSSTEGEIVVPGTLGGRNVTRIGAHAFQCCTGLTYVAMHDGIRSLSLGAFEECSRLSEVTLPESLEIVDGYAFYGCRSLRQLVIPESVSYVGFASFTDCVGLEYVSMPRQVEYVAPGAFSGCGAQLDVDDTCENYCMIDDMLFRRDMTEIAYCPVWKSGVVEVPDGVVDFDFCGCSNLTSVTLPESVTRIPFWSFGHCGGLREMLLPSALSCIEAYAFCDCSSLTELSIPNGVTSIGQSAFQGCTGLTTLTIPDGVASIGRSAFEACGSLVSLTIPAGVAHIDDSAFRGCSGLINVMMSQGVTTIENWAFDSCRALTALTIPTTVESLGYMSFGNCDDLTSIDFEGAPPEGLINAGVDADVAIRYNVAYEKDWLPVIEQCGFTNARAYSPITDVVWRYEIIDGAVTITGVENEEFLVGDLRIPSIIEGCPVVGIGDEAFYDCSALTSVIIPDGVVHIGDLAFRGCCGLTEMSLPSSLKSIDGYGAFMYCSGLTSVTIPSGVASIAPAVFMYCSGLTNVLISSSVTSVGWGTFSGCSNLMNFTVDVENAVYMSMDGLLLTKDGKSLVSGVNGDIVIPSSVIRIEYEAFDGRSGLTSVSIPEGVTVIGEGAFEGCWGLTNIEIPTSVTIIGTSAFYDCSGLLSVEIPPDLTSIEDHVFSHCRALKNIIIPTSVTHIGLQSFYGCSGLESVMIPQGVTNIGERAFAGCEGLESVAVPPGVASVSDGLFMDCSGLTSVVLPSGITNIGNAAFYDCHNLTSVAIPASVVSIGDWAFDYCAAMSCITIPENIQELGQGALYRFDAVDFECAPPNGLSEAGINFDATVRYNVSYFDKWSSAIEECGFTNATPYVPGVMGAVVFVVPNGVVSVRSYVYTNAVYGVLPEARRDGFAFAGWYTSLDGTNRVSAFSAVDPKVKTLYARWVENDVSLYAQWEANRYSVSFNANGGAGEMEVQPFLYDQVQGLTGAGFTKTGYSFKGWSTSADGKVVYEDGEIVSNLTAEAGFAVALFAQWEKVIDVPAADVEEWVYDIASTFKKQGETSLGYCKRFAAKYGDDYSAAFFKETGKIGQDGARLQVWHDYVAGTDPLDENDTFTATITIEDGVVKVDCRPKFADAVEADRRLYKTWGKVTLGDTDWVEVTSGHEGDYNFFKVTVEMK